MALVSSSFLHQAPVSLPLFKLSFCTTPTVRANLVWTHLPQRDSLFAVFDSVSQKDVEGFTTQKKILRLVRGGDLLEHIELENLALQARLDEERNRSQLLEDADRYVILLVKRPLLAMRYQLPNGQIRRIQLNFRPESGYDAALNALYNLGIPIREKAQPTAQPVSAALSYSQPYQQIVSHLQPVRLLPSPDFTYRPSTSNGFEHRPSSSAPEIPFERPWTAPDPVSFSQTLPPKRELPAGMQAHARRSNGHDGRRPCSAPKKSSSGLSSLDQFALPRMEALPNLQSQAMNMTLINHEPSVTAPPSSSADHPVPSQMLPPAPQKHFSRQSEVTTTQAASQLSTDRPGTLTPTSKFERTGALMKPPAKRKSRAKPKASKKPSSTKTNGSQEVAYDIQGALRGGSSIETSQPASSLHEGFQGAKTQAKAFTPRIPNNEPSKLFPTSGIVRSANVGSSWAPITHPGLNSANFPSYNETDATTMELDTKGSCLPSTTTEPSAHPRKPEGLVALHPGRQALTELAENSIEHRQATDDLSSTSTEPVSKYPLLVGANEVSPEEFMSQLSGFVHDFRHLPAPNPSTTSSAELAAYAAQPDNVRQAVIKNMIYEFLGDENFIKLAEDVSQEWTRIGLGF